MLLSWHQRKDIRNFALTMQLPSSLKKHLVCRWLGQHWLFFLVFSLFLCLISVLSLSHAYQSRITESQLKATVLSTSGAALVYRMMADVDSLLVGVDDVIRLSDHHGQDADGQVTAMLKNRKERNPYLMDLLVVNPSGAITHWTGAGPAPAIEDRDYIRAHIDNPQRRERFVGDPQLSKVHQGQWFFAVSNGYYNAKGELTHIIVAILDIAYLNSVFDSLYSHSQSSLMLASESGFIYMRVPGHAAVLGSRLPEIERLASAAKPDEASIAVSPADAQQRVISAQSVGDYDLLFIASLSLRDELKEWRIQLLEFFVLMVGMLLVAGFLTCRLEKSHRQLLALSTFDQLSGLYSRGAFLRILEAEIINIGRYPAALSVIMLDLDDFKQINDNYGHAVGDQAIQSVGRVLKNELRHSDLACRYGGEEFVVMLPKTSATGAAGLAEKLRMALDDAESYLSASLGVAELQQGEALSQLLVRVDQALYRAKAKGKNQICMAAEHIEGG